MFSIFKKKSKIEMLSERYEKLMRESHRLSTIDRAASDLKVAEAEHVQESIEHLKSQE